MSKTNQMIGELTAELIAITQFAEIDPFSRPQIAMQSNAILGQIDQLCKGMTATDSLLLKNDIRKQTVWVWSDKQSVAMA